MRQQAKNESRMKSICSPDRTGQHIRRAGGEGLCREHEGCSRRQASKTGEVERANPAAEPPSASFDRSKSSTARVRIRPSFPSSAHMLVLQASGYSWSRPTPTFFLGLKGVTSSWKHWWGQRLGHHVSLYTCMLRPPGLLYHIMSWFKDLHRSLPIGLVFQFE